MIIIDAPIEIAEVAEWQTRRSQKPMSARTCEFDSRSRHQSRTNLGILEMDSGSGAIDQIVARLAKYPDADFSRTESSISIRPPGHSAFPVDLRVEGQHYTVVFDRGWHEEFDAEADALNCVAFGLSSSCRLAVTYRGSFACSWAVQVRDGDEWKSDSVTGLLLFPFWRQRRVVFKQNDLIRV